jgi:hypothetical protein
VPCGAPAAPPATPEACRRSGGGTPREEAAPALVAFVVTPGLRVHDTVVRKCRVVVRGGGGGCGSDNSS